MSNPAKPEQPWMYAAPANALPTLTVREHSPISEALEFANRVLGSAQTKAEALAKDQNLSHVGRREAFTDHVSPLLSEGLRHQTRLESYAGQLQAEAEALVKAAQAEPNLSDEDRRDLRVIAVAIGQMDATDRMKAVEAAMTGRDPKVRAALAHTHHVVTGITEGSRLTLLEMGAESRIDAGKRSLLEAKARDLSNVRRGLEQLTAALEDSSNRERLKQAQAASLRRSAMSEGDKIAFITKHGLDAFQSLPA